MAICERIGCGVEFETHGRGLTTKRFCSRICKQADRDALRNKTISQIQKHKNYIIDRKQKGLCSQCGFLAVPNKTRCEKHAKQHSTLEVVRVQENWESRIKGRLRTRLNQALVGSWKSGSAVRDLGCIIPELKKYLEDKFQTGMTWANWGNGIGKWNIDHIIPLSKLDLDDLVEFLQAVHYTNLQPMWWIDNMAKGDKL